MLKKFNYPLLIYLLRIDSLQSSISTYFNIGIIYLIYYSITMVYLTLNTIYLILTTV